MKGKKGQSLISLIVTMVIFILLVGLLAYWFYYNLNNKEQSFEQWNDTITGNCTNSTVPKIRLYNNSYCKIDCGILQGILNISRVSNAVIPPQRLNLPAECNYTCYGKFVGWSC